MNSLRKIKSQKQLKKIINGLKEKGKTIAFTNGCFDILHYGHLKYLEKAKESADILVIAVNSDASVKAIKGRLRPINNQSNRVKTLSGLSCVDYLTIFNDPTPLKLIKLLKPHVLVKGGDWKKEKIVGADAVKNYNGKVITIPYLKGFSTTALIKKISEASAL